MKEYLEEGWKFSEFLNWIPVAARDEFLEVVGEDNIVILDQELKDNKRWRAKMLISPNGVEILNLFFMPTVGSA